MASISKLNTALLSMPNELTVAAANFNLDFTLMKVEAPKEFHGVRDALSSHRRDEAEEGQPHVTARKLGALFEAIVPPIPNLIQAYGKRASSISSRSTAKTQTKPNVGLFAAQAGIDGTTIWAAATSGKGALGVHLLACMLARIWKSHEAISLWVELVDRRKQDIIDTYNNNNAIETAAIMASKQTFSRQQLAQWDSSARSWLQTADMDRKVQQTQLMLVVNNVRLPVNSITDPYQSVVKAWTSAMSAMERLVRGIPQQVQDGAVLLAMSSWHLYPNMEVLVDVIKDIDQHDELMNGGLVTISTHGAGSDKEGVFWSLPLSRMRFYSPPVVTERHISSGTSRITMDDLWIVVLGIIISQWDTVCADIDRCCKLIISLSNLVNKPSTSVPWLKYLGDAAVRYTVAKGLDRRQAERLLGLGMRQCRSFLNDPMLNPAPFFGLSSFPVLMKMVSEVEEQISIMRRIAETLGVSSQDLIVRYPEKFAARNSRYGLATALPRPETPRGEGEPLAKRICLFEAAAVGHFRWIPNGLDPPEMTCDGSDCGCSTGGLQCPCEELGLGCSLSCHPSLETLSRCTFGIRLILSRQCEEGCDAGLDYCSVCSLRYYVSGVQSTGERCSIMQGTDLLPVDDWHFMLANPTCGGTMYDFLLGDLNGTCLFKKDESQIARYQTSSSGSPASTEEIEWVLTNASVSIKELRSYLINWWSRTDGDIALEKTQQTSSFQGLVFATELYESLNGSTINIEVVRQPLYEAKWVQNLSRQLAVPTMTTEVPPFSSFTAELSPSLRSSFAMAPSPDLQSSSPDVGKQFSSRPRPPLLDNNPSRLARSFACIAMFETGEFDVHPKSLQGVMALSIGDSIYATSDLLSDPSESTYQHPVRRVMGNLGRPEMAFLTPPSKPKLKDYDLKSWNLINHLPFDGIFEDNFSATSLHLSFTDFEMPLDVGVRGLRDTLVILVESLVSINDGGKHLGDLDVISLFSSGYLTLAQECSHHPEEGTQPEVKHLISIDSWAEFFDLPKATGIVRAYGNWQARLAIATASVQRRKRTLVLPQNPCLECLSKRDDVGDFEIIVA